MRSLCLYIGLTTVSACATVQPIKVSATHHFEHKEATGRERHVISDVGVHREANSLVVDGRVQTEQERETWHEYKVEETYHRAFVFLCESQPTVSNTERIADPHRGGFCERYSVADVPAKERRTPGMEWVAAQSTLGAKLRWSIRELVQKNVTPHSGDATILGAALALRIPVDVLAVANLLPDTVTLVIESRDVDSGLRPIEIRLPQELIREAVSQ